jgi:transcriptional regulator with XRE-family HTH domain
MKDDFCFSEWLMDEMEKRNLTDRQLAKEVGFARMTIWYYITEQRSPSLKTFMLLLDYFNKHLVIADN